MPSDRVASARLLVLAVLALSTADTASAQSAPPLPTKPPAATSSPSTPASPAVPTSPAPSQTQAAPALPAPTAPALSEPPAPAAPTPSAATPPTAPDPDPSASPGAVPPEATLAWPTDQPAGVTYPLQAPVYATPYAPDQLQQPSYGTYVPPAGYPQALRYSGPIGRAPGPGSHEHEGLFLRLSLGGGAASAKYRERLGPRVSDVKTRGLAITFDAAAGGRVVGNFILHANLSIIDASSNREIDGVRDGSYDVIDTTMWMIGAGGTYYFMPANLYLTLVVGTGGFVETRDYDRGSNFDDGFGEAKITSGPGFASSLAVGKEWWVGGRGEWAIGGSITGAIYAAPVDVAGVASTALGNCISVAFSATLN